MAISVPTSCAVVAWGSAATGRQLILIKPLFSTSIVLPIPGTRCQATAPRYFSGLRTDGIHNVDLSIYKEFSPKESMKLQVRADIFNLVNHPRSRAARFFLGSWRHPVWHHQFHRGRIHSAQNAIWAQIRILIRKPEEIQDEPKLPAVGFRAAARLNITSPCSRGHKEIRTRDSTSFPRPQQLF